jgi:alpha-mannosidase
MATRCKLHIGLPVMAAQRTDMLERPLQALDASEGVLSLDLRPFEVVTLRLLL